MAHKTKAPTAGELLLGGAAITGVVGLFWLLFKPGIVSPGPLINLDSITEWNPFSPSTASNVTATSPTPVTLPAVTSASSPSTSSGHIDIVDPNTGKSLLSQGYGSSCTTDSQCASGVCVNGSCSTQAEWDATA